MSDFAGEHWGRGTAGGGHTWGGMRRPMQKMTSLRSSCSSPSVLFPSQSCGQPLLMKRNLNGSYCWSGWMVAKPVLRGQNVFSATVSKSH
eukprot:61049-Pelagomonas_calceolata.AAC.3